jgi:hypothetical protein
VLLRAPNKFHYRREHSKTLSNVSVAHRQVFDPLSADRPVCRVLRWQGPCRSSSRRSSYGVPVGPFITESLYFTRDGNLWSISCLTSPPVCTPLCWWTGTSSTCLDLDFNPDQLQQLEAIQGIVLMLSILFFLIVLVILASAAAVFGRAIACGRPYSVPLAGTGGSPPTSLPLQGGCGGLSGHCAGAVQPVPPDRARHFGLRRRGLRPLPFAYGRPDSGLSVGTSSITA